MKKTVAILLVLLCLLPALISCNGQTETATAPATFLSDDAAIQRHIDRLRSGYFEPFYDYADLSAFVELGPYEGIVCPEDSYIETLPTQQEVDDYLMQALMGLLTDADYTEITENDVVQRYDVVTVDYEGTIDGQKREDATAEDQNILVGSNMLMPGFEDAMVGVAIGDTVEFSIAVSPYYGQVELIGKTIEFTVEIKKIQRPTMPELTLENLNEVYGTSFATMELFRATVEQLLKEEKESLAYDRLTWYLQVQLIENSTWKTLPQKELEHYVRHYTDFYNQYLEEGQSIEDFCEENLGVTYQEFLENANLYAQDAVRSDLIVLTVAKAQGIAWTNEQMQNLIYGLYEQNAGTFSSVESMIDTYSENYGPHYFDFLILRSSVMEWLHEKAQIGGAA